MDNFSVIYKILNILEKAMDYENFDKSAISSEQLKISENRWKSIIEMLADNEYIKGVIISRSFDTTNVNIDSIRITLKGLEYLNDNTLMKRVGRTLKGVKELKDLT